MHGELHHPPIIILGMHRSGTSMVARLLERCGLFLGWRRDENDEAWFFLKLNRWLLHESGASWGDPDGIDRLLGCREMRVSAREYLRYALRAYRVVSYLGPGKYLRFRDPSNLDRPWGWKDPRNTLTLPVWLDLFPEARVIHVCRHGVDVAGSLIVRQRAVADRLEREVREMNAFPHTRPPPVGDGLWGRTIDEAFTLWERYMSRAARHLDGLGDRGVEVRFEAVATRPERVLTDLVEFCGLSVDADRVRSASAAIDGRRVHAYLRDPELRSVAHAARDRLRAHGYDVPAKRASGPE